MGANVNTKPSKTIIYPSPNFLQSVPAVIREFTRKFKKDPSLKPYIIKKISKAENNIIARANKGATIFRFNLQTKKKYRDFDGKASIVTSPNKQDLQDAFDKKYGKQEKSMSEGKEV